MRLVKKHKSRTLHLTAALSAILAVSFYAYAIIVTFAVTKMSACLNSERLNLTIAVLILFWLSTLYIPSDSNNGSTLLLVIHLDGVSSVSYKISNFLMLRFYYWKLDNWNQSKLINNSFLCSIWMKICFVFLKKLDFSSVSYFIVGISVKFFL